MTSSPIKHADCTSHAHEHEQTHAYAAVVVVVVVVVVVAVGGGSRGDIVTRGVSSGNPPPDCNRKAYTVHA